MVNNSPNPFRDYRSRDSKKFYDDVRGILLVQLHEHTIHGLSEALRERVQATDFGHTYLDLAKRKTKGGELQYAPQFGVELDADTDLFGDIESETERTISFTPDSTWSRICAIAKPYRQATATVLAYRGFNEVDFNATCIERRHGSRKASRYLERHVQALHKFYEEILHGTPREE